MSRKTIIAGTLILTAANLITKCMGFLYRVFMSNAIGAEGMGLYQLTAPVLALTFSLTVSGMQTAISKFVASETTTHDYQSSFRTLFTGFCISMLLSVSCSAYIYTFSDMISQKLMFEQLTAPFFLIIYIFIPMTIVPSCFQVYF